MRPHLMSGKNPECVSVMFFLGAGSSLVKHFFGGKIDGRGQVGIFYRNLFELYLAFVSQSRHFCFMLCSTLNRRFYQQLICLYAFVNKLDFTLNVCFLKYKKLIWVI